MSKLLKKQCSAGEIAEIVQGKLVGSASFVVDAVDGLNVASENCLSFCRISSRSLLKETKAGIVLVCESDAALCPNIAIVVDNPRAAFIILLNNMFAEIKTDFKISPSAVIGKNCKIDKRVSIGSNCIIGDDCIIEEGVELVSGCILENKVTIGANSKIGCLAVICKDVLIGKRCVIGANAVIGKSGFGFEQDDKGSWLKVPQLGGVILEDDVEVGVNSSVDRGAIGDTILKKGVKCDNLVQIGHSAVIGENSLICGCVGISGSVTIGKNCILAGGAMVADNVNIADEVCLAGAAAVRKSIDKSGKYAGDPARPLGSWLRDCINISNLAILKSKLNKLEKK